MRPTGSGFVRSENLHGRWAGVVPCEASSPHRPPLAVCFVCPVHTSVAAPGRSTADAFGELGAHPLALSFLRCSWLIQLRASFIHQLLRLRKRGSSVSVDFALGHDPALHQAAKCGPNFAFAPSRGNSPECRANYSEPNDVMHMSDLLFFTFPLLFIEIGFRLDHDVHQLFLHTRTDSPLVASNHHSTLHPPTHHPPPKRPP